ncbi:hypothetical protein D9V96_017390 [Zobellia laminariae]|uniref:hypothetical protein n=1 Tax=Zobellia laminariae TaxID=248906 RepID=UPI0012D9F273|nr:hypothetical protein [Zobellia laminariae]MUH40831.1 hypothetical protein [Zobellia laminariae]WKX76107.1 hypothetical protein Q5W13_21460 [Zobellia laminariae]
MLRKLVDYKKLDHKLGALLIETYADGYGDDDIIVFKNLKGETIEAVELKTEDTIYLVKISKSLSNFIANFEENIEKELEKAPQSVNAEDPNYQSDDERKFDSEDQD